MAEPGGGDYGGGGGALAEPPGIRCAGIAVDVIGVLVERPTRPVRLGDHAAPLVGARDSMDQCIKP